jgi:hypothetical protein
MMDIGGLTLTVAVSSVCLLVGKIKDQVATGLNDPQPLLQYGLCIFKIFKYV